MPIYYFDIRDNSGLHNDTVGLDLPDLEAAILEGRRALSEIAAENRDLADQDFELIIHDHGDGPVRLTISVKTERDPEKV